MTPREMVIARTEEGETRLETKEISFFRDVIRTCQRTRDDQTGWQIVRKRGEKEIHTGSISTFVVRGRARANEKILYKVLIKVK